MAKIIRFPVREQESVAFGNGEACSDRKGGCRKSWSILLYTRDGTAEARLPDGSIKRLLWQTLVHRYPIVFKRKRNYIFKKVYR